MISAREKVSEKLKLRCIFPCSLDSNGNIFEARCMYERKSTTKLVPNENFIEDIITRLKSLPDNNSKKKRLEEIKYLLQKLTLKDIIKASEEEINPRSFERSLHPGVARIYQLEHTSSDIILIQAFAKHSLLSVSRFLSDTTLSSATLGNSSGLGAKDLRIRFIVYQLLQSLAFIHEKGLCLDSILPEKIMLDDDMWLYFPVGISDRACNSASLHLTSEAGDSVALETASKILFESWDFVDKPIDYYEPVSIQWVSGKLSNFEYLMAVNSAAGRTMMDPLYHPILPWVTDFSCFPTFQGEHGGLRDLNMTKFRLSKGDAQLETTYRHSDPPHHIPESLSELTYYIYMARRTPLQVLRRVVRDVFVPEHYPHSMGRIYDWTPDECIPEFFFDPTVFQSIHKDLGLMNLELPAFAPTPEEFITYHRSILESDEVSRNLHRWIDLTFGYCLVGDAAVNNMNVPLRHTLSSSERVGLDSPNINKNPGFVVLFDSPHPRKEPSRYTTTAAHIYSYDNSNLNTNDLLEVNETYAMNNRTKFNAFNNDTASDRDVCDVQALVDLDDYKSPLALHNKTFGSSSIQLQPQSRGVKSRTMSVSGMNGATSGETHLSLVATSETATVVSESTSMSVLGDLSDFGGKKAVPMRKKSLVRPPAESSVAKLRGAGPINLDNDPRCSEAASNIQNQVRQFRFSTNFDVFLEAKYSLPRQEETSNTPKNINKDSKSTHTKPELDSNTEGALRESKTFWDNDFAHSLSDMESCLSSSNTLSEDSTNISPALRHILPALQGDDMLAVGCVIAELYTGRPLLSGNDALKISRLEVGSEESIRVILQIVYRRTSSLPLVLRRLIALLLQRNLLLRPTAAEVLQSCVYPDFESWGQKELSMLQSGGTDPGIVDFSSFIDSLSSSNRIPKVGKLEKGEESFMSLRKKALDNVLGPEREMVLSGMRQNPRVELLGEFCTGLFPTYFKDIYQIIGEIKLCRNGLSRMRLILTYYEEICSLPLEGLSLTLCHFLHIVGDATPFLQLTITDDDYAEYISVSALDILKGQKYDFQDIKINLISDYPRLVDLLGLRLGVDGTERLLVPKIIEFLSHLNSSLLLQTILRSNLWQVVLLRAGVRSFLRYFLPLLLTYVSAGTLRNILAKEKSKQPVSSPIWTKMDSADKHEWLDSCDWKDIREIQCASLVAINKLMEPEALGLGLCSRYLLPALISLVGVPQLANAGFGYKADMPESQYNNLKLIFEKFSATYVENSEDQITEEQMDRLQAYIVNKSTFEAQHMFVVNAIVDSCSQFGDMVISELILSKIFNGTISDLEFNLDSNNETSPEIVSALMEVILLLNKLLPTLFPETVQKDYLQPARVSLSCLPRLLTQIPLMPFWCLMDETPEEPPKYPSIDGYVNARRRYIMHVELCRLIVSSSMIAGAEACTEYVLPSLDVFFRNFVSAFGMVPIESKTMLMAFEMGAELFLPLAQLTGPEAFYTAVPNLNPRLEMWLVSVGSNLPAKSPPLPANIWPEATTEVANQPEKKKGFLSWISSRSKWVTSSSTSQTPLVSSSPPAVLPPSTAISYPIAAHVRPSITLLPKVDISDSVVRAEATTPTIPDATVLSTEKPVDGSDLMSPIAAQIPLEPPAKAEQTPRTQETDMSDLETSSKHETSVLQNLLNVVDVSENENLKAPETPIVSAMASTDNDQLNESQGNAEGKGGMGNDTDDNDNRPSSGVVSTYDDSDDDDKSDDARVSNGSKSDNLLISPTRRTFVVEQLSLNDNDPNDTLVDAAERALIMPEAVSPIASMNKEEFTPLTKEVPSKDAPQLNTAAEDQIKVSKATVVDSAHPFKAYQRLMSNHRPNRGSVRSSITSGSIVKINKSAKKSKVGSILFSDIENADEVALREQYYSELTWLLAGSGRWNVDKDLKDRHAKEQSRLARSRNSASMGGADNWNPAAHVSLTSPRIAVDVATDAGTIFALNMQSNTQWKLEDAPGLIKCMVVNPQESLLMTCSRTGVRVWSLSSHPLLHVSSYMNHSSPPFNAGFLRSGIHAATCDGSIHIWDIETRVTLGYLSGNSGAFSSMSLVPPRFGIVPSMGACGDEMLLTTSSDSVAFYDIRCSCARSLNRVAEFLIPPIPPIQGNFITSSQEPLQLTCAASHENYLFAGSSGGALWVLDRRTGRTLTSWQAHDGPILKINPLSENHFLAVSDRSAAVWEYVGHTETHTLQFQNSTPSQQRPNAEISPRIASQHVGDDSDHALYDTRDVLYDQSAADPNNGGGIPYQGVSGGNTGNGNPLLGKEGSLYYMGLGGVGDVKRVLNIKNMPDHLYHPSTLMISTFDHKSSSGGMGMSNLSPEKGLALPSKPQHVLYCISGHKLYAGRLPSYDVSARDNINIGSGFQSKESTYDELRLHQSYFADRKGSKLVKSKLQVTSSVMLPLRKLLLLGTEDGLVRIVS